MHFRKLRRRAPSARKFGLRLERLEDRKMMCSDFAPVGADSLSPDIGGGLTDVVVVFAGKLGGASGVDEFFVESGTVGGSLDRHDDAAVFGGKGGIGGDLIAGIGSGTAGNDVSLLGGRLGGVILNATHR
jgi:hypothetical protein